MEFYSSQSKWGRTYNGKASNRNVSTYNYNVSAQLNWNKDWNKTHHFDAMVAGEMTYYYLQGMNVGGYNFTEESTGAYNIGKAGIIETPTQDMSDNSKLSFISRVNYNYKKRYYLTMTVRADGSSKFYPGNRVGWFPSASFAWRINEEPWLRSIKWIDNLKFRLSAGASGNDRVSNYAALATLGTNYYSIAGSEVMGMAPTASANPKLKWETTYQYDAGIDFSVLKEKINLTADVYYKDTRDMLYRATLSAQTGYTQQWQNLGRVENKGFELAINTHNIDTRDFSWSTSLTFDMSRNKVLDIGGIDYTMVGIGSGYLSSDISRIMVGQPIGIGWGYISDGNYQLDDFVITDRNGRVMPSEAVNSKNLSTFTYTLKDDVVSISGKSVKPGDRKYKDIYGNDNVITTEDRTKISDSNPKFTAGLGNTITWKNFDLNIFLESVYGRQILSEFKMRSESGASGNTFANNLREEAWLGRWTPENKSQTYSRLLNQTNTYSSSYYVEDGSYLRIRTLSLGYSLGKKAISALHIRSGHIAVSVDNLHCFTSYSGNDPDVSSHNILFTGFDRMSYPKGRTWSLTFNIGF
jgi:TonB-linked SusC/RagA family outer membrane protein